jgi:hypothetical protein
MGRLEEGEEAERDSDAREAEEFEDRGSMRKAMDTNPGKEEEEEEEEDNIADKEAEAGTDWKQGKEDTTMDDWTT